MLEEYLVDNRTIIRVSNLELTITKKNPVTASDEAEYAEFLYQMHSAIYEAQRQIRSSSVMAVQGDEPGDWGCAVSYAPRRSNGDIQEEDDPSFQPVGEGGSYTT